MVEPSKAVEAVANVPQRAVRWSMPALRAAYDGKHAVWVDLGAEALSSWQFLKLVLSSAIAEAHTLLEHDVRDGRWWVRLTPNGRAMVQAQAGQEGE